MHRVASNRPRSRRSAVGCTGPADPDDQPLRAARSSHGTTARRPSVAAAAAIGLIAALCATLPAQVEHYSAHLDGAQAVPPVTTSAFGWAVLRVDVPTRNVRIVAHASGLAATAAHLHGAAPGINGPVIVPLSGGPVTWSGTGVLTQAQLTALQAGDTYVNLHTPAHPGGEIRGDVQPAKVTRFSAVLDGAQSVPPNGSTATGRMTAFLHEPDRVLVYEMDVTGLSGIVAHIHRGAAGISGGVVYGLVGGGTRWCGVTPRFGAADLSALLAGDLYVNVHTTAMPAGQIRGQLRLDSADFRAHLDGTHEVPPVATAARGEARATLLPDRSVEYRVVTAGLTGTAAHFHLGLPGVHGGVVFPLGGGPTVWQGRTPALSPAQVADLQSGRWYVDVHTLAHPGGEIRGQVELASLPSTYGGGCPLGSGGAPEIGSGGIAMIGSPFEITVSGARPASVAVVLFGLRRDAAGGVPLPLSLAAIGASDCFLLHDNIGLTSTAATDTLGCASMQLVIPMIPGLAATIHAQAIVLDATANPLGIASTNALSFATR